MDVQAINQQAFCGIKLSTNNFEKVREMVFQLKKTGFDNIGHRTEFCSNTVNDKIEVTQNIRKETLFKDRQFGALFLPWSKEAYIIATPKYEQFMYPVIKQYDKGAKLNLAI